MLIVLLLHLVNGFGNGMVKMLFNIAGFTAVFIISLLGSRLLSGIIGGWFGPDSFASQYNLALKIGVDITPEQMPALVAGLLVFLLLFILLSLLFRLYSRGFRWVNRIPVVGLLNRAGGGVLGAVVGAAFVYIIIAVLSLIPLQLFINAMNSSHMVSYAGSNLAPYAIQVKEFLIKFYIW